MKVRLARNYDQWYWNSGTNITITKDDKYVEVDEDNPIVKHALESGFLEVVTDEILAKEEAEAKKKVEEKKEEKKEEVLNTSFEAKNTIKEVVTKENKDKIKEVLGNGNRDKKFTSKED